LAVWTPFIDGYQAEIVSILGGEVIENRLWFLDRFGTATVAEYQELSDGIAAWYSAFILPFLSSDVDCQLVKVAAWATNPPPTVAFTSIATFGGIAEQSHSANVAAVVRFVWTDDSLRKRKNKNFIGGIPLSGIDLNTLTATYQDILFEAYAALIDAAPTWSAGNIWRWVLVSLIEDNAVRPAAFFKRSVGPVDRPLINIGQRRKRLPA